MKAMVSHRVSLLGGFRLLVDGREVDTPATTQRMVAALALRGRSSRGRLAGMLWAGAAEARALASLRTAIWRANQLAPGLIGAAHDCVVLGPDVEVDVTRMVELAHTVMADTSTGARAAGAGRGTARVADDEPVPYVEGDLLPGWDDAWLAGDRERLRQLRLHVLEARAVQLARCGRFGLALEAALGAVRADPLRESAHRTVIRIHLAEGNAAEAMQAYAECAGVLRRRVGVAPSLQTRQLVAALAGRRPSVTMGA